MTEYGSSSVQLYMNAMRWQLYKVLDNCSMVRINERGMCGGGYWFCRLVGQIMLCGLLQPLCTTSAVLPSLPLPASSADSEAVPCQLSRPLVVAAMARIVDELRLSL